MPRPGSYVPGHAKVKDWRWICFLIHRVFGLVQCILKLCHIVVVRMVVAQIVVDISMPVVAVVVVARHQRGYVDIIYGCNGGQQVVVHDVGSCKQCKKEEKVKNRAKNCERELNKQMLQLLIELPSHSQSRLTHIDRLGKASFTT